jgi:hypothetical protein
VIADDNLTYFSLATDEQADLTVYFAGKKRYLTGKIIADDIFRRDSLMAQTLQLFDLRGA